MNEIRRLKEEMPSHQPIMADLKKEIRAEKTGLAAGNNFLIDHVASQGSAPVANPDPNAYLAINWQRGHINTRFTSKDRRFPTPMRQGNTVGNNRAIGPSMTTSHVFWPGQRRKAVALLPISQPISKFLGAKWHRKDGEGGGGGQPERSRRKPCIDKLARNFPRNASPTLF
jgi:hypothetical protein